MPVSENVSRGTGLSLRIPESKLQDIEKKAAEQKKIADEYQNKPEILSLAAHIQTAWQAALRAKQGSKVEQRLVRCLRQKNGEYDPEKISEIKRFGGSDIFMRLTNVKVRAAEAWIRDILLPPGEKPWSITPTPIPELPAAKEAEIIDQVFEETVQVMMIDGVDSVNQEKVSDRIIEMQEAVLKEKLDKAKKQSERFERHIDDQLTEGNYYQSLGNFISDICTFPTAFLKGPVIRRKRRIVWTEDREGNYVPAVEVKPVREYNRVSPFDIYPSPGAKSIQDGYLLERARIRRGELQTMIGVPGFKEEAVRTVLQEYGEGGLRHWLSIDQERADAERRHQENDDPDPPIDCLIFWGSVQGKKLINWGMTEGQIPDPDLDYQICAWLIGRYVVMARVNPHPLGKRPYYADSYDPINDSIWGNSPPELMRDVQAICNACARSIVNNMSIASGPQVEVYQNRVQPGENIEDIYPWKIWKTKDDGTGAHNPAVQFFQPDPIVDTLLKVYEYFFKQASEQTGIPSYVYGSSDVGGAGKTASGLSMLMNAAGKVLKGVIAHIDEKVIKESIKEHWNHVMLYDSDIEKMGDVNVVARASEHLIIAEQLQLRRSEMLDRTNNPWDMRIIGDKGRSHMLRETFDSMKMDADSILPSEDEMRMMEAEVQRRVAEALASHGIDVGNPNPEIPPAEVIDAAGGAKGNEPGRMMNQTMGLH